MSDRRYEVYEVMKSFAAMSSSPACNCPVWPCTCDGGWPPTSGRFCHLHGSPHPKGLLRLWQRFLYWRVTR